MMSGFMSYFGGRKDSKQVTRDAIVGLREQLVMLEKKEEYLTKKIDEELKKAKSNAVSNKTGMHRYAYQLSFLVLSLDGQWPPQHYGVSRTWKLNSIASVQRGSS